jgi:DnaA family protein
MKQIPLAIGSGPEQDFDNFLAGANAAALAHLQAFVPGAAPAYLWGPAGCGKTHLLKAVVRHFDAQGLHTLWFSSRDAAPWEWHEGAALVVFDGCDRFDEAQQHAAFTLFVEASTRKVAVAAAGRLPPIDLPLREDLRTRLGWGHVFALQPLAEAEVRAVLRREADRRGIFLGDEVMDYLLTRFARDLKSLMNLLDQLDRFALASKRAVTVPLLRQMLAEEGGAA